MAHAIQTLITRDISLPADRYTESLIPSGGADSLYGKQRRAWQDAQVHQSIGALNASPHALAVGTRACRCAVGG
jgi:hypothetical protein